MPTELTSLAGALLGLAAAWFKLLDYLSGTGLGFEAWARQMQNGASVVGAIVGAIVCLVFLKATRTTKLQVTFSALGAVVLFLVLNIAAAVSSRYVTSEFALDLIRDVIWKYLYFLFCCSLIMLSSCIPFFATK